MVRTRVGYAGGSTPNPVYHHLDDHSETVEVDYDPLRISFQELLNIFWASHNPASHPWSRQYMSIIFYHSAEQKRFAEESKAREEARRGRKLNTEINPYTVFYLAEDYHQKYWLQQMPELMGEFRAFYPDFKDFVNSTAAARVNGYLGDHGTLEQLEEELGSYGLSHEGNRKLRQIVGARREIARIGENREFPAADRDRRVEGIMRSENR